MPGAASDSPTANASSPSTPPSPISGTVIAAVR